MKRVKEKLSRHFRAQLSLEYLILLAAFFSVLLLVLPLVQRTYALALFGFDVRQALSFSREFAETSKQLSILAEKSSMAIEISALHDWTVHADGKKLLVSISSAELGKTKLIESELALETEKFEKTFNGQQKLVLRKNGPLLTIDSYP